MKQKIEHQFKAIILFVKFDAVVIFVQILAGGRFCILTALNNSCCLSKQEGKEKNGLERYLHELFMCDLNYALKRKKFRKNLCYHILVYYMFGLSKFSYVNIFAHED